MAADPSGSFSGVCSDTTNSRLEKILRTRNATKIPAADLRTSSLIRIVPVFDGLPPPPTHRRTGPFSAGRSAARSAPRSRVRRTGDTRITVSLTERRFPTRRCAGRQARRSKSAHSVGPILRELTIWRGPCNAPRGNQPLRALPTLQRSVATSAERWREATDPGRHHLAGATARRAVSQHYPNNAAIGLPPSVIGTGRSPS